MSQFWKKGLLLGLGGAFIPCVAVFSQTVNTYTPCLDYMKVGPSNCTSALPAKAPLLPPVSPTTPTAVATASATTPHAPTLDDKIDEFLKNQGKPPREFVAFYLDPTPENALKWANTFKELQTRNQQITEAWTQAEQYIDKAKNRGEDTSKYVSTSLPPVQGVTGPLLDWNDTEAFYAEIAANPTGSSSTKSNISNTVGKLAGTTNPPTLSIGGSPALPTDVFANIQPPAVASNESLRINYYFSATCAYCKKFTPEFKQVLSNLGNKAQVECVDLTTPTPQPSDIEGQLSCTWRTPTPGEIEKMGIKTTPSLIVYRGNSQSAERINGYVEGPRLEKWLKTGKVE